MSFSIDNLVHLYTALNILKLHVNVFKNNIFKQDDIKMNPSVKEHNERTIFLFYAF
jgi:hypothetical protein